MKLLMESVPREPEKRTLPAHLECRDLFACEKVLNSCEKQTSSHFVGPRILISVKTRITVKLGHFTFYFFFCVCVSVCCHHEAGCSYVFQVQMCLSVMGECLCGIIKREVP